MHDTYIWSRQALFGHWGLVKQDFEAIEWVEPNWTIAADRLICLTRCYETVHDSFYLGGVTPLPVCDLGGLGIRRTN